MATRTSACRHCGAALGQGAGRCGACGTPVGGARFQVVRRAGPPATQFTRAERPRTVTLLRVPKEAPRIEVRVPEPRIPADLAVATPAAEPAVEAPLQPGDGAGPAAAEAAAPLVETVEPQIEITLPPTLGLEEPAPEPAPAPVVEEVFPAVMPDELEGFASLVRGVAPEPGIQLAPYAWRDLNGGDPPPKPHSGDGAYAVYHAIEVDQDVRITHATLVSVRAVQRRDDRPVAHRIVADARVTVQKRALLEMMDAARARADQDAHRSRAALARKLARKRERILRWPRWATPVGFALVRGRARAGLAVIHARRRARRGLVEVPDALFSSALRVSYHLGDRLARRSLWQAIKDPTTMSQEQRSVTLFLTTVTVGFLVLLLNSFFALGAPEHANLYRNMLKDAALQFVGLFGAPIIIEPLFIFSALAYGGAIAFTAFFAGKMLAAWVLYLLGDSLHHHIAKKTKGPRGQRMVAWLQKNANRYGLLILVLDNALPLAPDQLMLVLAVSGIRFRTWMLGIGVGTVIKFGGLLAGMYYLGPERVGAFFHNPFG